MAHSLHRHHGTAHVGFQHGASVNIDTIDFDSFDIPERVVQGTFSC
jgi:hypothetical protein